MPIRQRTPIDWGAALDLHEKEGWTYAAIAREYGYAYKTVRVALRKRGVRARRPIARGQKARKLRDLWRYLHAKCEQPAHHSYGLYGAQGARVAEEWKTFEPFYKWALAERYRSGLRIARVDGSRPYGPENCVWVTREERLQLRKPPRWRKRKRKKPQPIDWVRAKRLYLEEGLSQPEVARRVGASYVGIVVGFKRLGLTRPRTPAPTSTLEGRRLQKTWDSLHARCTDPSNGLYLYNGAQGVKVCKEWREFRPFLDWALRNGARPGLWLTRLDRKKDYSPQNCAWVTPREALLRKRPPVRKPRPRRVLSALGERKGIMAWSRDRRCSVSATAISSRLASGWDVKSSITEPAENRGGSDGYFTELVAFGEKKGITDWTRDRRCKVGLTGLVDRLHRGWKAEDALATPPYSRPGGTAVPPRRPGAVGGWRG